MADKKDYYALLDVDKTVTQKQIKDAYRKLARKLHPDVNPDPQAVEQFKEVGEAYSVLSDADKRAQYDQFGHAAFTGGGAGQAGWPNGTTINIEDLFSSGGGGGFGDIFEELFGAAGGMSGRQRVQTRRKGADLQFVIELSLEECALGVSRNLRYRRHSSCHVCGGSGGSPETQPVTCSTCHGTGYIGQSRGFMTFRQTCPRCHGMGSVNPVSCRECGGQGAIEKEENLEIKIPPGVDTNSRVRYESMGEAGPNGGPPGDLYIIARVKEHDFYVRKGDNLFCEVPINLYEAVLGAKIRVPTLSGTATVNIPSGSTTGDQVTLKGKGIPHLRGWGVGNQVIQLKVTIPATLSREQKNLFKKLQELDDSDVRKHLKTG